MAGRWGKLYRDSTPAELAMEEAIATLGVPYRNQFPGYLYGFRFFPDFLLPTLRLIIEVDDESHGKKDKKIADQQRTEELNALGYTVVRCTNKQALTAPMETLKSLLREAGQTALSKKAGLREGLPQPAQRKKLRRGEIRALQKRGSPSLPPGKTGPPQVGAA